MFDIYEPEDVLNEPDWAGDGITVEFIFAGGLTETVKVDTADLKQEEIRDLRRQILGKRKLIQSIFEHGTHGQITVQGLTVRADDLIAVNIR